MAENERKWVDIDLTEIEVTHSFTGWIGPAFLFVTIPELADQEFPPKMEEKEGHMHVSVYTDLSEKEIKDKLVEKILGL